jgi:hypothetical protein
MTDAERIWRAKSDDELLVAAAELDTYEDEGQRVIRDELRRRDLEDPVDQARFIAPEAGAIQPEEADAPPAQNPICLRCEIAQRYLGARWFRQGASSGELAERGPRFEISQSFDVYVCPRCGHVDLFFGEAGGEMGSDLVFGQHEEQ